MDEGNLVDLLESRLLSMDEAGMDALIAEALATMAPQQLAEEALGPALRRLGLGWQEGSVALSQVYVAGRMCERALDGLLPDGGLSRRQRPRMAIASLEDYHDLGLRIVSSVLRASGFEVRSYHRQDVKSLAALAKRDGVELLFVSTLMLRSALRVRELRKELGAEGEAPYLVVGGAPFLFDPGLYLKVRADGMGRDATEAVRIAASRSGGA